MENDPKTAEAVPGVMNAHDVTVRWVGHRQRTELHITVDGGMATTDSHRIAEAVRHELLHALPALLDVTVHVDPSERVPGEAHQATSDHRD